MITFDLISQYELFLKEPTSIQSLVRDGDGTTGYEDIGENELFPFIVEFSIWTKNLDSQLVEKIQKIGFIEKYNEFLSLDFRKFGY